MIKKWLLARHERKSREAYARGWDWAAGELLRGMPEDQLDAMIDFTFDTTAFDYGAQAALLAWEARRVLTDVLEPPMALSGCCGGIH